MKYGATAFGRKLGVGRVNRLLTGFRQAIFYYVGEVRGQGIGPFGQ